MSQSTDRYEKITAFSLDPVIDEMDLKYDPYLELHGIDSIFYLFKIESLDPEADILTYKFSWNTDYEPPIELKRDIIALYNKHFEN